jgi:hypothetical protein
LLEKAAPGLKSARGEYAGSGKVAACKFGSKSIQELCQVAFTDIKRRFISVEMLSAPKEDKIPENICYQ